MAAARFDCHAEGEVGVLVGFGDGLEAVRGAGGDIDGHRVAFVVVAWILDCYCLSWRCC